MRLAERLAKLEERTGQDAAAERAIALKRVMRLILSDVTALGLARAFTQTLKRAPEQRAEAAAKLHERLVVLRKQRRREDRQPR